MYLLFLGVVVVFTLMCFIARYPLDPHFHWMGSQSNTMARGWPLEAPFIFGLNLYTHYLYNGYLYNVGKAIGLMPLELSATLSPVLQLFGLIGLIYDICAKRLRAGLFALLAVALFFGCYGYDTNLWKIFHSGSIVVFSRVQSSLIGASLLMVLFGESRQLIRGGMSFKHWRTLLLVAFLLLIATGVRVQAIPIFIFATGWYVLAGMWRLWQVRGDPSPLAWNFRKREVISVATAISLIALAGLFFYWGMYFFFGRGQAGDPAGHLEFGILNWRMTIVGFGFKSSFYNYFEPYLGRNQLSVGLWLIMILIGRLSFMLPGAIAWGARCFNKQPLSYFEVLFLGVYAAGVVSMVGLTSNVNEQWQFFFPADFAMAMLSAVGLAWLFRSPGRVPLKGAVVFFMVIAGALHVTDICASYWRDEPIAERLRYFQQQRDSNYRTVVAPLQEHGIERPVVLVVGDLTDFDSRRFASNQHNIQLYGEPRQMNWVTGRGSSLPSVFNRRKTIINSPLNDFNLRFVAYDIRKQNRDPVVIVVGWEVPPCYDQLELLYAQQWDDGTLIRVFTPKVEIAVTDRNAVSWWKDLPKRGDAKSWWDEYEMANSWWPEEDLWED